MIDFPRIYSRQRTLFRQVGLAVGLCLAATALVRMSSAERATLAKDPVSKAPPAVANAGAEAKTPAEMKPYTEELLGTDVSFEMVPIPGGEFIMGSPEEEAGRGKDESPQHPVKIAPFWMGKHEVTWNEYDIWSYGLDIKRRELTKRPATERDILADAITKPTKPYTDMTFGMGHDGYPAICMTGLAAKTYCDWLTEKTGRYYRLPTEAEWEYACRAGTKTAYSFGDDESQLDEYGWHIGNSNEKSQKIGLKKPNPWGLFDMHGNVAEWCVDQYDPQGYSKHAPANPFTLATKEYPQVVRGGSWDADPPMCRSAARDSSNPDWKMQDPQLPKSRWFHTDARFVGFRVVRPLTPYDIKQPATTPNKEK
jgi:formylglycine-generating enzyme required for sulfatase activity